MKRTERYALAALAIGLPVLVLGPSLLRGGFVGDEGVDVWSHVWGMAWFADSLVHFQVPWTADGLRHPEGGVLWYIDVLGALLATPWMAMGAMVAGYNLVLVAQSVLAAVSGWFWERSLGGAGPTAAVALATTPFLLCTWSNGVLEAGWLGLVALAGALAMRESRLAGLVVGLAFVATPYLGISAAVVAGVALLTRGNYRLLAWTWGIGAVVALPMALGLAAGFDDPRSLAIKPPPGPRWPTWRINGVDPRAFIQPGDFWSVRIHGDGAPPFKRTPYLGITVLVGTVVALVRRRVAAGWVLPVLVGVVLALGPVLYFGGDFVRWASGDVVWLPFGWVWSLTGVGMDHPLRFVSMALVVLAGCAGAAVGPKLRFSALLAGVVAVEHLAVAPNVWPLPTSDGTVPLVYDALEGPGAVIDLPADKGGTMETSRYLYWHAVHGRPIPYGNKVSGDLLRVDNDALRRWMARRSPRRADRRDLAWLYGHGYRFVVVHRSMCGEGCSELVARVSTDLGTPEVVGEDWVWRVPGEPG